MMNKAGSKETVWLFVILIISRITLDGALPFVKTASQSAAISSAVCAFLTLFLVYVTGCLFKDNSLDVIFADVYGRYFKKAIYIFLLVITVFNVSDRLNLFADTIGTYILDDSPKVFIAGVFSVVTFIGAYLGLEALTRFSYLAGITVMLLVGIIIISCFGEAHVINIYPLLNGGIFSGAFKGLFLFSDIIYFYIIGKEVVFSKSHKNAYLKTILKSGAVIFLITLFYTLCVPYPANENFNFPLHRLASLANSSVLIQRLDGLVFLIWIFSGFISVSVLTYFSSKIFKESFNISDSKAVLPILTLIIFLTAMSNISDRELINSIFSVFFVVFLPLTAIIYKIKSRRKNNA